MRNLYDRITELEAENHRLRVEGHSQRVELDCLRATVKVLCDKTGDASPTAWTVKSILDERGHNDRVRDKGNRFVKRDQ
jgi:hypothetical protein